MSFEPGDRIVYTKRGETTYYNTEWPGVVVKVHSRERLSVRLDGRKRLSVVRAYSLHDEPVDDGYCRSCDPVAFCTAGPNCVATSNRRTPPTPGEKP